MQSVYYVRLDLHKKTISYCVKDASGRIQSEGTIPATPRPMGEDSSAAVDGSDAQLQALLCTQCRAKRYKTGGRRTPFRERYIYFTATVKHTAARFPRA
jgi:hypothetical protein